MRQQTSGQNQLQFMVHTEVMPPLVPPQVTLPLLLLFFVLNLICTTLAELSIIHCRTINLCLHKQRGRRRGGNTHTHTFESMPPDPPRRGPATHAPFLTRPPSSQLAPTPPISSIGQQYSYQLTYTSCW